MRTITKILLLLSVLGAVPATMLAQGVYTAASCSQSDVNAVVNGPIHRAVDGDTINIPAGSCTWRSALTVPNGIGISLVGSGTPNSSPGINGASSSCSSTVLIDDLSSGSMIAMSPINGNSVSRISCMKLLPTTPNPGFGSPIQVVGGCNTVGCPNFRLDNIIGPSNWAAIGISDDTFAMVVNVFGVADHNTIGDVQPASNGVNFINVSHAAWKGVGGYGDNSWATPDTFGTQQAFYIENNTLSYALITDTDTNAGTGGGGRFVCRFNTVNSISSGGGCTDHGTDTTGRARGGRQYEAYGNTGTCTNAQQGCGSFAGGRSGVGMIFGNSFTNSGGGFFKGMADLDAQRRWRPDSPWGACDGTSPWDTNDSSTYYSGTIGSVSASNSNYSITDSGAPGWSNNQWKMIGNPYSFVDLTQNFGYEIGANSSNSLTTYDTGSNYGVNVPAAGDRYKILRSTSCIDQPGRGAGLLVNGSSPVLTTTGAPGPVNQVLDPSYEFADSMPGTANHTLDSNSQGILANREYFAESVNQSAQSSPSSPFNGQSGTGHGTLANRPTTCTPHVGYWATDQGDWNQSGNRFGNGALFVCTSTNTWTLYYTPYAYPHPIISGGGQGGDPPDPPTNLVAIPQ
jgi:hypothetical protein